MQKPRQRNPIGSQRLSGFYLTYVGEGVRLFLASGISAGIAARRINNGHPLMILFDSFCQVSGNFNVIVGMADHDQDVHFIAAVGLRRGRSGLRLRCWNS